MHLKKTMNSNLVKSFALIFLTLLSCKTDLKKNDNIEMANNKQSVENLWRNFIQENPNNKLKKIPVFFYFCDNKKDADECVPNWL